MLFGLSKAVTVNVASDNPYIEVYDGVLYTEDGKRLLLYPTCHTATSYTVREGTEAIAASAFNRGEFEKQSNHDYLTTVVLPASIRTIENCAFYENTKLSSINIPTLQDLIDAGDADASGNIARGVTIGKEAFFRTKALQNITLPNSITSIGESAFHEGGLTEIEVPGSVETIEKWVFRNCLAMNTATLNVGTKHIRVEAFSGCIKMGSISFPEGLLTIEKQAFALCIALPSITIPSTVKSIGDYAFVYNYRMKSVDILSNIEALGKGVFMACNHLENITLPTTCKRYEFVTYSPSGLKLLLGNSNSIKGTRDELVLFIPKNLLGAENKKAIQQWVVPLSVKKICAGSIGMTGIESILLPANLQTIEELAFFRSSVTGEFANEYRDVYIKELTIPAKVTSLHFSAFFQPAQDNYNVRERSTRFKKIYFMGTPTINTSSSGLTVDDLTTNGVYHVGNATIPLSDHYTYAPTNLLPNNNLAFYVKNSNLSNSVFNNVKTKVATFSSDIPDDRLTEKGKVITMSRDFDMDFSNSTGMKAYIATGYDEGNNGIVMKEVKYVPSRTGSNNNSFFAIIVRQTGDDAGTYRIGENDYNSGSQTTTLLDGSNQSIASSTNRLRQVVVNTHVQGTEDGVNTWGLSGGKWLRIENTGRLTPYNRSYLKPTAEENAKMLAAVGAQSGSEAKISMLFMDDLEVTGITNTVDNSQLATDSDYYTLDGRRLQGKPTQKGIYIHNGKKEIVK